MVYLVGAGPGHPGLMTCKGLELLKKCDAVIYDRLGTTELLDFVSPDCHRIYVGKKAGSHYKKQEEINEILVDTARKYNVVVRLKGGDPFVFGRGGEEILVLQKEKIPFQIVPGVTSAISVPELLGIPVTHRKSSRSFHVFTGHTRAGEPDSLAHIHKEEGTSVFLMGLSHLSQIVDKLLEEGQKKDTPVSVISGGTMPTEKKVTGTLETIVQKVQQEALPSPAIIVVGETAGYQMISADLGPLCGKKIGVVGTASLREKMRDQLEAEGAAMFSLCDMQVEADPQMQELFDALQNVEQYSWIAFTSQNGIDLFFKQAAKQKIDLRRFAGIHFAVVGSGTREALAKKGFLADFIPEEYTTEAMAEGLVKRIGQNEKLLLPRARRGSQKMVDILKEHQINATILPIYDVTGRKTENWSFLYDFDVITFASASGVEAFVSELGRDSVETFEKRRTEKGMKIGTIGQVTARALEKYGIKADVVPEQCDIAHLIKELKEAFRG